ncbi:MAG: MFS transporter [Smithellaceae bacterium]
MKKRWLFILGYMLLYFLMYIDRVNLSVSASTIMKEYNFTGAQIGWILGGMMPGFMLFSLIGGAIADRVKPMKVVNVAIVVWSLSMVWFVNVSSLIWMYITRIIFGAGEGSAPPPMNKMVAAWMLPTERGKAVGLGSGSTFIGMAIGAPVCSAIIAAYSWQTLFYVTAAFGVVVIVICNLFMRSTPQEHPGVSKEELAEIETAHEKERIRTGQTAGDKATKQDYIQFFKSPYIWLTALGFLTTYMLWWANLSWLPGYLVKEKGMTVLKSGFWSSFPFLIGALGLISAGHITDKFFKGRRIPYIIMCKIVGPILVFLAISAASDMAMIIFFAASMFFTAAALAMYYPFTMDSYPQKLMATAIGFITFIGGIGALFAPVILGKVYDMTKSFYWGFGALAIILFIGALIAVPLFFQERRLHSGQFKKAVAAK